MDAGRSKRRAFARTVKLALEHLPESYAARWGPTRKAQVVDAIEGGLLRLEDALDRYRMSVEEYHSWCRDVRLRRAQRVDKVIALGRRRIGRGKAAPPQA